MCNFLSLNLDGLISSTKGLLHALCSGTSTNFVGEMSYFASFTKNSELLRIQKKSQSSLYFCQKLHFYPKFNFYCYGFNDCFHYLEQGYDTNPGLEALK